MRRLLLIALALATTAAAVYAAALSWYDGNRIRTSITTRMLERHGVDLQIASLERSFELRPVIRLESLRVANAANPDYELVEIDQASFRVYPMSFLIGELTFDDIRVDGVRITVPVDEEGALYWDPLVNAVSEWLHRFDWSLRHFKVRNLQSESRNVANDNDFLLSAGEIEGAMADAADLVLVASDVNANLATTLPLRLNGTARLERLVLGRQRDGHPVTLDVEGAIGDKALRIKAEGGNLLEGDPMERDPLRAMVMVGDAVAQLDGTMSRDDMKHLDLFIRFENPGEDGDPDLHVELNVSDPETNWRFSNISARQAESELTGDIIVGSRGDRRFLEGALTAKKVNYPEDDDEPEDSGTEVSEVLPEGDLFSNLFDFSGKFDADFRFRAEDSTIFGVPFGQVEFHALLDHGSLVSAIENATIRDAELSATFNVTPQEGQAALDFDASLQDAPLSDLVAGIDQLDGVTGDFDGNINLRATGKDTDSVLGSAAGRLVLFLEDGAMPDELATRIAGDVFTAIFADFDDNDTTPIRCAIVDFSVEDGVARSRRMIMDTGAFNLYGKGEISLGEQRLDIELVPRAKDFSLVSIRVPLRFHGPFDNIEFNPDVSEGVASLLTPIEFGLEDDASCAAPRMAAANE